MIEIIPAIDIIDGACVRLKQGVFENKTVYGTDPLEIAQRFEQAGIKRLHCVDLDGARRGKLVNVDTIGNICRHTELQVDVGGGIAADADIEKAFTIGATHVTAGSIAVREAGTVKTWMKKYGAERIILGADFKNGRIAVSGWQETSDLKLFDFLESYVEQGIGTVISTDISRDGMLAGAADTVYESIKKRFPNLYLIASGGISSIDDIRALDHRGIDGAIVGKAIYEGHITLKQIREYQKSC